MAIDTHANDAGLARIAHDLIGVRERLERMDHAQDALIENGKSLQGQLETLTGQITHMIQILTPERPEQEGPSLSDLLARILTQQAAMTGLLRQIAETVTRPAPAEAAGVDNHAANPTHATGHA